MVRGMKKKTSGRTKRPRLPITPPIMQCLLEVWERRSDPVNGQMVSAAACMSFFGFLRTGEVVVPSETAYDAAVHLSVGDVRVDNRAKPTYLEVVIKASKTDVFRKGVTVVLGVTGRKVCPVATILSFMANPRPAVSSASGPFFVFSDVTRERFVKEMRAALKARGFRVDDYAGHSFRIGAAMTAASHGMPDSLMGRWESTAYTLWGQ